MADIRSYIQNNLLDPLKLYPTAIQQTMIETITDKLEELYNYTLLFPSIVAPDQNRLDILKVIADQFLFTIRDEADLQEQIDILTNILHVYNRRGSIDTIENMWKYYGGDLPKDVKVIIPSYNLFRWSVSEYSGTDVFQDGERNRTGIYEIKLTNSTYPIPELKQFLLKELVAAGNYIYFTNAVSSDLTGNNSHYKYDILEDDFLSLEYVIAPHQHSLVYSGDHSLALSGRYNEIRYKYWRLKRDAPNSAEFKEVSKLYNLLATPLLDARWSGKENIFVDISNMIDHEVSYPYIVDSIGFYSQLIPSISAVYYRYDLTNESLINLSLRAYCTPSDPDYFISRDLYNDKGERVKEREYFILGESLLDESLGYEIIA